jgi:hypothetical protein
VPQAEEKFVPQDENFDGYQRVPIRRRPGREYYLFIITLPSVILVIGISFLAGWERASDKYE